MLLAAGFVPTLLSLKAFKSRALRRGVWFRLDRAARALLDVTILYLKKGGRIRSPVLAQALKATAEKILALTTPLRVLAKAISTAIARAKGIEAGEERAVAPGLQWVNMPDKYKGMVPIVGKKRG